MNHGRIEQAADPITLYESPKNLFVAAFIGAPSMNFVEGRLEKCDGGLLFRAEGGVEIGVSQEYRGRPAKAVDLTVVLGIRPEHTMNTDTD